MNSTDQRDRLVAILAADAAGYSLMMSLDALATVTALEAAREIFKTQIEAKQGRIIDMAGDSVLAVFETATGAVSAALAVQEQINALAETASEGRRMLFRIGLHLGDVIEKADGTVYGDGVNIAARLEGLAEPGGIAVSASMRSAVKGKIPADFQDRGEQQVKNIADPVRVYAGRAADNLLLAITGVDVSKPVAGFGGRPALAVMPFANLSGDTEQEYFADGLAEDILTRLALWRCLPVIARNSSFAFKGRPVDSKVVGRELGAHYVLEGSVRKVDHRVRVNGRLVDTTTGHQIWAERYDRELQDLFAIQDDLADGIVGALEGAVGLAETERAHLKKPGSLDAWDSFQRGMWHLQRFRREDLVAAVPLFRRSIQLDSGLAGPHSGVAAVRLCEAWFLWTTNPREALAEAKACALAAIAIDPLDAMAYGILGYVLARTGKHDEALAMCQSAIEHNPSYAAAYAALATTRLFCGEYALGIEAIEKALRISPQDSMLQNHLSLLSLGHYLARNYERAAEVAKLTVLRDPHFPSGWRCLAIALGQVGDFEQAREALEQCMALLPGFTTEQAARASLGFRDEAVFQHWLTGLRKAGWRG
ncbi:adenylate/guanylate cyclase domain-containing protein [Variovorax sp. Sphag1AA]|uniref:adenylate/guanylate cyclase domain-containing protein n=1 Tax=Variovorax sp. Sphag1AA TaxID=2587027 RepID=UPI001619CBCA|nr:adenylate/guanylate cyclase domain-containing protein [Variovorax sp. Sphag1AA]MBB3182023.1 adenylate cyclase [Variovorax sp. Sphag1AA]